MLSPPSDPPQPWALAPLFTRASIQPRFSSPPRLVPFPFPHREIKMAANGCTVKDVPAAEFITTYAAYLKRVGLVELPPWVDTVKTAPSKELAPYDQDWLYIRIGTCFFLSTLIAPPNPLRAHALQVPLARPAYRYMRSTTPLSVSDPLSCSVYCEKDLHPRRNRNGRIQEDLRHPSASRNETVPFFKSCGRIDPKCLATTGATWSYREGSERRSTTHYQGSGRNGYASRPVSQLKRVNALCTALTCCVTTLFHNLRRCRLGDVVKINSALLEVCSVVVPTFLSLNCCNSRCMRFVLVHVSIVLYQHVRQYVLSLEIICTLVYRCAILYTMWSSVTSKLCLPSKQQMLVQKPHHIQYNTTNQNKIES